VACSHFDSSTLDRQAAAEAYFFNRIGRFPPVETDASRPEAAGQWVTTKKGAIQLVWNPPQHFKGYAAGVAWKHALHAQLQTRLVETTVVVY